MIGDAIVADPPAFWGSPATTAHPFVFAKSPRRLQVGPEGTSSATAATSRRLLKK